MDSSAKFLDTVKAEAVLRHRRTSRLKTLMAVLEACSVLLVLLSCCSGSSLSLAVDSTVYHSLRLLHLFRRPLWAFLLSNAIIIAVAILSVTDDGRQKTGTAAEFSDRIYDEYISRRRITQVDSLHFPVMEKSPEETSANNAQIVPYVAEPEPKPEPKPEPAELNVSWVSSASAVTATGATGERHHRRTRSAALTVKSCRAAGDRALRRSMTEKGLRTARCRLERRSVDDLSNEEFNRTVENYIARTRWFLKKEMMADLTVVPIESYRNSNVGCNC